MKEGIDYRITTDPWGPGPGWYVALIDGPYKGVRGYFNDINVDQEKGSVSFGFVYDGMEIEDRIRIDTTDPKLQGMLLQVLKDVNNRLGDVFFC